MEPQTLLEIPIFPLTTVLYPAGRLPLRIFEPRYVEMTKVCLRDQSPFGVTLIRAGYEVGQPAIPCDWGCTARIAEWDMPVPSQFRLLARGESRFRIRRRWTEADGLIRAEVELAEPPDPLALPERYRLLGQLLERLIRELGAENFPQPARLADAAWVAYRLCELLPVAPERKQQLLEESDPRQVLQAIEDYVQRLPDED